MRYENHQTVSPEIVRGHCPKQKAEHASWVTNRAVEQSNEYRQTVSPEIVRGHCPPEKREFEIVGVPGPGCLSISFSGAVGDSRKPNNRNNK